jgi:hypothetical protein
VSISGNRAHYAGIGNWPCDLRTSSNSPQDLIDDRVNYFLSLIDDRVNYFLSLIDDRVNYFFNWRRGKIGSSPYWGEATEVRIPGFGDWDEEVAGDGEGAVTGRVR